MDDKDPQFPLNETYTGDYGFKIFLLKSIQFKLSQINSFLVQYVVRRKYRSSPSLSRWVVVPVRHKCMNFFPSLYVFAKYLMLNRTRVKPGSH